MDKETRIEIASDLAWGNRLRINRAIEGTHPDVQAAAGLMGSRNVYLKSEKESSKRCLELLGKLGVLSTPDGNNAYRVVTEDIKKIEAAIALN